MPYFNIVWIKLYLELFDEDDRFLYQLTERQQLLYIKMLYLAGRQKNKISKNARLIIHKINYQGTTQELLGDIKRLKEVFKKFQENKYYYTFIEFDRLHNQIRSGIAQGKPKGSPKSIPDKDKDKDKDKEEEEDKNSNTYSKKKNKPENIKSVIKYFQELGSSKDEGEKFYDYFSSNGWKVGGKAQMKDWKAAARNWVRNHKKYKKTISAPQPRQRPARIVAMEMITAKIPGDVAKMKMLSLGYKEHEIDEALGKKY